MTTCTTKDGLSLFYTVHSKAQAGKPSLLFIHGWVEDWTTWDYEIDHFVKQGYGVISFDLRGHGRSGKAKTSRCYSLEHFLDDISKVCKATQLNSPIIIGHSMGGLLALAYQSKYGTAQKLVICATTAALIVPTRLPKWGGGFVDFMLQKTIQNETFMRTTLPESITIYMKKYYDEASPFFDGLRSVTLGTMLSCLNMMLKVDMLAHLKKIDIPVLVIEGTKDKLLPSLKSLDVLEHVTSRKVVITLEGSHFINKEQPEKIAKLIEDFVEK